MDIILKKTSLLILKGIFASDFSKEEDVVPNDDPIYSKIPKKFVSVEEWPFTTNLKCWACDRTFEKYPKFIPTNPEKDKEGNSTYDVVGNFCEWNCVVQYINDKYKGDQRWDILRIVSLVYFKFTGHKRDKIMPSPPKEERKEYCGSEGITNQEYQNKINQLNIDYDLTSYCLNDFKVGE